MAPPPCVWILLLVFAGLLAMSSKKTLFFGRAVERQPAQAFASGESLYGVAGGYPVPKKLLTE